MKKKIAAVFLFLLLSLVLASPAFATSPTTGTGLAEYVTSEVIEERTADGNTFTTQTEVFALTGVIEGIYTMESVTKTNKDGSWIIRSKAVCDPCTVGGRSGAVVFRANYHDMIGLYSVIKGSGDLARLHGQGSIDLDSLELTFHYHFD